MAAHAIEVSGLGKSYRLGRSRARMSFREAVMGVPRRVLDAAMAALRSDGAAADEFWALADVAFTVAPGSVVGIIGKNGSGKSTLLKILSRITQPSTGRALIRGRVGALLEVGTGFNPELTGRENIFLNGAILGMQRRDIARRFDAIVDFAGVETFLDTPVKRYSSGMYVRLAFAVAAHLEPEILLVDEVLAVGDAAFQQKCLGKMQDAAQGGRTILFVSHNLGAVQSLCERVLWLDDGRIADDGDAKSVIERYLEASVGQPLDTKRLRAGDGPLVIESVTVQNADGEPSASLPPGAPFTVAIAWAAREPVMRPHFWLSVLGREGALFTANMLLDGRCPERLEGRGVLVCSFPGVALLPQTYTVNVGVRDNGGSLALVAAIKGAAAFRVVGDAAAYGMPPATADGVLDSAAPVLVPYQWTFGDGAVASPPWVNRK